MYYTVYKITNLVNQKYYIGQHITKNLYDSYMGSGIAISSAIKKYGVSSFKKDILYVFDNFTDMNNKEIELINSSVIKDSQSYNIILGGMYSGNAGFLTAKLKGNTRFTKILAIDYDANIHITPHTGSLIVKLKSNSTRYRISSYEYKTNKHLYNTPSSGMVNVKLKGDNTFCRVSMSEYTSNKHLYDTASTNKVSIRHKITGNTSSINISEYDYNIHEKVFGGIVSKINGKNVYVPKDKFYEDNLDGIHKGMVTALNIETNKCKHITQEEFHNNRHLYNANGYGTVVATNKISGISKRISREEFNTERNLWTVTTEGYTTVYDIRLSKFCNVLSKDYNPIYHKRASDKKFICYNSDSSIKFQYWGSKKNFIDCYNASSSLWACVLNGEIFNAKRVCKNFNGCYFKLIKWY